MDANSDKQFGTVTELLPNALYRVALENGKEVLCYLSGKIKLNRIRIMLADRVLVVVDPFGGKATNRIIRRINQQ